MKLILLFIYFTCIDESFSIGAISVDLHLMFVTVRVAT